MCGIFTSTRAEDWRGVQREVLSLLEHRGPDEARHVEVPGGPLMAQTRLSIIGLGLPGRQPWQSPDGLVTVVYNGEIYNYQELAVELGLRKAETQSDTQVLGNVLAGPSRGDLTRLRGMFAFAAWDDGRKTLTAMRDPFGIKPLYCLRHSSGGVSLSSELGPLLLHPDARVIDNLGMAEYLALGRTGPALTMFQGIQKLIPGRLYSWTRFDAGRWEFAVTAPGPHPTFRPYSVSDAVDDSVRAHLIADVEVGSFLSGGMDSTLLTALANRHRPGIRSFTLSFPESSRHDESAYAEANAKRIGTHHTTLPVTYREMAAAAAVFVREHGEPFGDAAALPLTLLARFAAEFVRVVLVGEGADELFGGYARYRVSRRLSRPMQAVARLARPLAASWANRRGPSPRDRAVEALLWGGGEHSHSALLDGDLPLLEAITDRHGSDLASLLRADWVTRGGEPGELGRARDHDLLRWLPNVYLEKSDCATMAASVEARLPYLDGVVAAAAAQVSGTPSSAKAPLRAALSAIMPDAVLPPRKQGLAVDTAVLVGQHMAEFKDTELHEPGSLLSRWLGHRTKDVADRCSRSPTLAFRVAMLGVWDAEFHGERFTCD